MAGKDKSNGFLAALRSGIRPYRGQVAFGLSAVVICAALEVTGPMLLKSGVDSLRAGSPIAWLYGFSGLIVTVAAISGVFRFFMRKVLIGASRLVESDIREGFFRHLLNLSPSFFDLHHTGDLMARSTEDVERLRMVLGPALMQSTNTLLTLGFSSVMMFYLDVKLALLVLLLAPLIGGLVLAIARYLHRANLRQQEVYGELTTMVQENISGIRVVKAFVREDSEAARFRELSLRYFRRSLTVARLDALFMPTLSLIVGLGVVGIVWIGGRQAALGQISLGSFIAFMSYLSLMTWPMMALGWTTHLYQRGKASYHRLQQIQELPEQFSVEPSQVIANDAAPKVQAPEISFCNIRFRYREEGAWVFDDLNLKLPAGSTVAVVGRTGSGKSTLVRLLARLYQPQSGVILLDGDPWDGLPVEQLRKLIGYVDQTPFLYSATIRENICFGLDSPNESAMVAAARTACFDQDVEGFPERYETRIGERGVTLSGGQQQRLSLARALVMDTPMLILDDCLSAVDAKTEREILNRLKESLKGRTTLFVTHRLAAAERADAVALIGSGRVEEFGSHAELMALDGEYARMYRRQTLVEEIGEML